jgi:hypothetical protein
VSVIIDISPKGSPGVSLGTWGLFHCWPRPVIGLEADPSGGSWALTHGLSWDPGLMDLAAEESRASITTEAIDRCSIAVTATKRVVCAPKEPLLVRRGLEWLHDRLGAWPASLDVIVDAGRCDGTHPMLDRADAVLVWTRTDPQSLGATAALLASLERNVRAGVVVRIVTVGDRPYTPTETVEALADIAGPRLNVRAGAALPFDPRLAEVLTIGGRKGSRLCSSWFGQLATDLATETAHRPAVDREQQTPVTLGGRVRGLVS